MLRYLRACFLSTVDVQLFLLLPFKAIPSVVSYWQLRSIKGRQMGFSLFEVLSVVLILSLFAGVVWNSSMANLLRESSYEKAIKAQKSLASGLLRARQYAVQAQHAVVLCGGFLVNFKQKNEECGGNWSLGWSIQLAGDVKAQQQFSSQTSVHWTGFPANKKYIRFHANGHTDYQNGTFILCVEGWQNRITVNQSGRFYLGKTQKYTKSVEGDTRC